MPPTGNTPGDAYQWVQALLAAPWPPGVMWRLVFLGHGQAYYEHRTSHGAVPRRSVLRGGVLTYRNGEEACMN